MGTSKIIVGLGAYVMIGMYTLLFTNTDQAIFNVAQSQSFHDQARQISTSGIKFSVGDVGGNSAAVFPSATVSFSGGSVTYAGDRPAGLSATQMRITSTGSYNGFQVTMVAILQYTGVKWTIQRIYQVPDPAEYSRLS
ncbi:MAG TPA: hypothetical protein VMF88_08995 [Bacteroidota bacterium]|nr:hypothetical protein [Bacteroidota bacterium]